MSYKQPEIATTPVHLVTSNKIIVELTKAWELYAIKNLTNSIKCGFIDNTNSLIGTSVG